MTRVSSYDLQRAIARGGMGEVWAARHASGERVVVKVITGEAVENAAYLAMFEKEVQATAKLHHRNVVAVFDYGTLPENVVELGLTPGSPYYVMEWIDGGSAAEVKSWSWRSFVDAVTATLRGLAHAHARDVLHRDIKPSNLMIEKIADDQQRYVVTDFGVAHALDRNTPTFDWDPVDALQERTSGTPHFMAPEQLLGQFRDYGPWTDLYAVGTMSWYLVCGRMPFRGKIADICRKQLKDPLPALRPRFDVPDGFEAWLDELTHKDPAHRFRNAAVACRALLDLGEPETEESMPLTTLDLVDGTAETLAHEEPPTVLMSEVAPRPPSTDSLRPSTGTVDTGVSWLPSTWVPSGTGLVGLRTIPFVGREEERETVWSEVTRVIESGSPGAVVIRGLAGTGKSRLARWLCERVLESGVAEVMRAFHQPNPSGIVGLSGMLAAHYRCVGLGPEQVHARLNRILDVSEDEVRAISEMLRQQLIGARSSIADEMLLSSGERVSITLRAVQRAATGPLVVWLDDVQWAPEALDLVQRGLEARDKRPILFLLTAREEALTAQHRNVLTSMENAAPVETLSLEFLNDEATWRLVRRGLALSGEPARVVAKRCGGSPLFATQLVSYWLETGQLRADAGQLVLSTATPTLPESIENLWLQRVEEWLQVTEDVDAARRRLEVAASLGESFDEEEWHDVCAAIGIAEVANLVRDLLDSRLLYQRDNVLMFAHGLLCDAVIGASRAAGRWGNENIATAHALRQRYDVDHPGLAARVARHYLQGGAHDATFNTLAEAITRTNTSQDDRALRELYDVLRQALLAAGAPDDDPRWIDVKVSSAENALYGSHDEDLDRAATLADEAVALARTVGTPQQLAFALQFRGHCETVRGRFDLGYEFVHEAMSLVEPGDDVWIRVALRYGQIHLCGKGVAEGRAIAESVIEHATRPVDRIWALSDAANGAMQMNDFDVAAERLREGRALAREHGVARWLAPMEIGAGDRAYWLEDFVEAEEAYHRGWKTYEAFAADVAMTDTAKERTARCMLLNGKSEEALPLLLDVYEAMKLGQFGYYCHPASAILGCAAMQGNYELFEQVFEDAFEFVYHPDEFQSHVYLLTFEQLRAAGETERLKRTQARARSVLPPGRYPEVHEWPAGQG